MRVRALQYMYYDKKGREVGDEYEMDDREESTAKLLATLGKIEIVGEAKAAAPAYRTAAVKAEEPPPPPAEPMTTDTIHAEPGTRRYYRRRDMKAGQ